MSLDLFNNLKDNLKENKIINNFLKQLANYLENDLNIIGELKSKYKISEISENKILKIQDELIKNNEKDIENKIRNIAEKIIKQQNEKLENYRKENHLYIVEEDRNGRIYLKDLTLNSKYVFEEVDFPEKMIKKATEGTVFEYVNGEYKIIEENEK